MNQAGQTHIIAVDDDLEQLQSMAMGLGMAGYQVRTTHDAHEALAMLAALHDRNVPVILITDIEMPSMNGCTLIEAARQIHADLGVIVITGHGTWHLLRKLLGQRIDDYLDKPFGVDQLTASVWKVESRLIASCSRVIERQALLDMNLANFEPDAGRRVATLSQYDALSKLAASVGHDCNNWLGIVMGEAEMLLDDSVDGRAGPATFRGLDKGSKGRLQIMVDACEKASQTLHGLVAFAKGTNRPFSVVNISQLVQDIAPAARRILGERITLCIDPGAGNACVLGDATLLENAVMNLLLNARDAMPGGGTIRLGIVAPVACGNPGRVMISVRDTGCGMTPEIRQRIFVPFFTTKGKNGNGLGLPGVLNTVAAHQGSIEVDSAPGAGTEFRIHLPLHSTFRIQGSLSSTPEASETQRAGRESCQSHG